MTDTRTPEEKGIDNAITNIADMPQGDEKKMEFKNLAYYIINLQGVSRVSK